MVLKVGGIATSVMHNDSQALEKRQANVTGLAQLLVSRFKIDGHGHSRLWLGFGDDRHSSGLMAQRPDPGSLREGIAQELDPA
jgi:hypothetical protein